LTYLRYGRLQAEYSKIGDVKKGTDLLLFSFEKHNINVILYISNKGMRSPNIIKVPKKYEPRPLPLTGKIINTVKIDERIFEPANWTFNLSDFDVR